jgi:hypothetical protein
MIIVLDASRETPVGTIVDLPGQKEEQKKHEPDGGEENTEGGVTDAVAGLDVLLWRSLIGQCPCWSRP